MASRLYLANTQEVGGTIITVRVRIFPNGASNPEWAANGVASVTHEADGKYLITLQDTYRKLLDAKADYRTSADNVDMYAQMGAIANVGTSSPVTAVVKLKTGATNTDAAAAATDNELHVTLTFEDSTAWPLVRKTS